MRRLLTGNPAATRRQPRGKDISAPAEDLHNKNPSLVALGNLNARTRERARGPGAKGRALGQAQRVHVEPIWDPYGSIWVHMGSIWAHIGPT